MSNEHSQYDTSLDWQAAGTWYDANAAAFASGANVIDTSSIRDIFTEGLSRGARILDAGCGSGRDAAAFLDDGFQVGAFDISRAMCEMTKSACQERIAPRRMGFTDFSDPPNSWNGIWAMASLIHLPLHEIGPSIRRLVVSLAPGGRFYTCIKDGEGERRDDRGRAMSYMALSDLDDLVRNAVPPRSDVYTWSSGGKSSGGYSQIWNNVMVRLPE